MCQEKGDEATLRRELEIVGTLPDFLLNFSFTFFFFFDYISHLIE